MIAVVIFNDCLGFRSRVCTPVLITRSFARNIQKRPPLAQLFGIEAVVKDRSEKISLAGKGMEVETDPGVVKGTKLKILKYPHPQVITNAKFVVASIILSINH